MSSAQKSQFDIDFESYIVKACDNYQSFDKIPTCGLPDYNEIACMSTICGRCRPERSANICKNCHQEKENHNKH